MIPILKIEGQDPVAAFGTLTSLDGEERAPLGVIRKRGQAYALTFGVFLCEENPPSEEGKIAVRKPVAEWDFDSESPAVTYELIDYVPDSVTRAQGKAALIQAGLWGAVVGFVDSIADPVDKALAEVALNDTLEWQRTSPFLNAAAQALDIGSEGLDALFQAAAEIEL